MGGGEGKGGWGGGGGARAKAREVLRRESGAVAAKKADRALGAGVVAAYVHNTKAVAALVQLSCETDFVARNEAFDALAHDLAMQVAATNPRYLARGEVPEGTDASPEEILLEQPFIKGSGETVQGLLDQAVQKFGERVEVVRVARFSTRG